MPAGCFGGMCGFRKKRRREPPSEYAGGFLMDFTDESIEDSAIPQIKTAKELASVSRFAADKLVVIDFYASWCQPCQKISPLLEHWVDAYPDVLFVKVNIDRCERNLLEQFNIQNIPTFVFIRKQKKLAVFNGGQYPALKQLIETHRGFLVEKTSELSNTFLRDGVQSQPIDNKRRDREKNRTNTNSKVNSAQNETHQKSPLGPMVVDGSVHHIPSANKDKGSG